VALSDQLSRYDHFRGLDFCRTSVKNGVVKRFWRPLLLLVFVMNITTVSAFAAVKAGAACLKVNQSTKVSGTTFRCGLKEGKLVWIKIGGAPIVHTKQPPHNPSYL